MANILRITRKELSSFFGSPVAYLFIGAFLAATLFVFFWVEAFFSRNIADTRPLFDWMPLLLIFLAAALTMRLWSEERRAGTLELLATLPVATWRLVLGKFLAAWALVAIALALTLPLPLTVALIGPLDWGPVVGAYLATLLLAAAYIAIGLFVSARTDNPIVALIGTTLVAALFYLIGSPALTSLAGHGGGELLRLLGSGSRFESITRGVIDLRDLYYYLSLVGAFLLLSVDTLERLRWATDPALDPPRRIAHHRWSLLTGLAVANLLAANLWLHQVEAVRADLTRGSVYSLSETTQTYLDQLQEPLLIRGYFSAETHPLLAPLVPQLRDLLREYQAAGNGRVVVELIDPHNDPEREREAGEQYGIQPVAFQTASKYQAGIVNSYFDILVKYGDSHEVLGFQELIDVKVRGETDLDVVLRNPEYDLTRAIKKVLYGWQAGGDLFAGINRPLRLRAFVSDPSVLPEPLPELRAELESLLDELAADSGGRFGWEIIDPASDPTLEQAIAERYGLQPLVLSLLDPQPFYFDLVLERGEQAQTVPLPEQLDAAGLRRSLSAAIKHFTPGVLRSVALYRPESSPSMLGMDGFGGGNSDYSLLEEVLQSSFNLIPTDLRDGQVPEQADLLLVIAPKDLDERQRFAIDQFLMQGGTVILAAAPLTVDLGGGRIRAVEQPTGLEDWLAGLGLRLGPGLVLDPQNTPFPIPVQRQLGGFLVEEIQMLPYPYFPDVRDDGLSDASGITAGLGQLTMTWAAPISIDAEANAGRQWVRLIESSAAAWTRVDSDVQPDLEAYPELGFERGDDTGRKLLGVLIEGRFESAFSDQPSPLRSDQQRDSASLDAASALTDTETPGPESPRLSSVVEHSPSSARLILFGSSSFLSDTAISLATEATQSRYLAPLTLIQNAIDWSLEDRGLLTLRGRGQYNSLLEPVGREQRILLETLNYLLALGGLALVFALHRRLHRRREQALAAILEAKVGG
ncbi:Gldg family protein [Lamprobacter modestohalophilus]|uniref:Gldg family protein n=1 Tax=Lamprobacter modestohalophilus TaxID=1064514 RepID=UPI002ADEF957|nr:Gldg family protein [Lamprobacter modestohalophilus]MEA1049211.1 Gldg family protein [Lamprobacter modestohalophilus]